MGVLRAVLVVIRALLVGRTVLVAENLALRQQLAVLRQGVKRPTIAAAGSGVLGAAFSAVGGAGGRCW